MNAVKEIQMKEQNAHHNKAISAGQLTDFVDPATLAKELKVSRNTIYEGIRQGWVPGATRVGSRLRIDRVKFFNETAVPFAREGAEE